MASQSRSVEGKSASKKKLAMAKDNTRSHKRHASSDALTHDDESDYLDSDEPRKKPRVQTSHGSDNDNDDDDDDDDDNDDDDAGSIESDSSNSDNKTDEDSDGESGRSTSNGGDLDDDGWERQLVADEKAIKIAIDAPSRIRRRAASDATADDAAGPAATAGATTTAVLAPTDPHTTFTALGVSPWLVQSLANMAIRRPTAIQKGCIPAVLRGDDCIGGSRTGSGKTVAFAVPILQAWAADPSAIFALVLTPTRELALQIYEQFVAVAAGGPHLKAILVTGGADMRAQAIALAKRPHLVIATPGRLADHIRTSGADTVGGLARVRFVVLDEADRLLTAGTSVRVAAAAATSKPKTTAAAAASGPAPGSMLPDVETCLGALPPAGKRQTLLFTATVTAEVRALKKMPRAPGRGPVFVCEVNSGVGLGPGSSAAAAAAVPDTLQQMQIMVPVTHREHYLHVFLSTARNATLPAVIVFCNRGTTAAYLHHLLRLLGHRVTALHGGLPQRQRTDNLGRFRAAAARILVATDVAARGLDIPEVALVINYDVPRDPDDYIHRVGRTARAGRSGDAVTLVGQRDVDLVHAIQDRVGRPLLDWHEDGVNLDTRVVRDALKLVSEKKREALLEIEENREVGGKRKRGMQKLRAM